MRCGGGGDRSGMLDREREKGYSRMTFAADSRRIQNANEGLTTKRNSTCGSADGRKRRMGRIKEVMEDAIRPDGEEEEQIMRSGRQSDVPAHGVVCVCG